jgi:hypothetical protein
VTLTHAEGEMVGECAVDAVAQVQEDYTEPVRITRVWVRVELVDADGHEVPSVICRREPMEAQDVS